MIAAREFVDAGLIVFDLESQLTSKNAHDLLELVRSLSTAVTPAVIVNMSNVKMLDSSGIGALVSSLKHVRELNGKFVLSDVSTELQRMIHLMNLNQIFDIYETEDVAMVEMTESKT